MRISTATSLARATADEREFENPCQKQSSSVEVPNYAGYALNIFALSAIEHSIDSLGGVMAGMATQEEQRRGNVVIDIQ